MLDKHTNTTIIPPVVSTYVTNADDVIVARDTARRVAMLLGLSPLMQARYSTIAAELTRLVLKTNESHRIDFYGIQNTSQTGVQLGCQMPWLINKPYQWVKQGLEQKLCALADTIEVSAVNNLPHVRLTIWYANAKESDNG